MREKERYGRFLPYAPDQAYRVPPSVKDELGEDHLCFFIHEAVEHMDLQCFEQVYGEEGGELYCPALMLKVWRYAYAVGMTSARRLQQRIREDLGLRYLAGGARPNNWALSAFRRRHGRGLNDVFTQVLEMARGMKLGRLGQVAIDSTRIQAAASRNRLETEERLRQERAQPRRNIRKWQKQCDEEDPNEGAGTRLQRERLQEQLQEMPRRLEKLRKSGMKKRSRTDEDARFLRERDGFALGYTAEVAVNEDHLIVGQRVTQNSADNHSLIPIGGRSGTTERSEGGESSGRRRVFLAGKHHRTGRPRVGCVRAGFELGTGVEHGTALSANPPQQKPSGVCGRSCQGQPDKRSVGDARL